MIVYIYELSGQQTNYSMSNDCNHMQILDTPSLIAEGSKGVKKNIFKEKAPQPDASTSSCCWCWFSVSHPIPGCLTSTLVPFQIIEDLKKKKNYYNYVWFSHKHGWSPCAMDIIFYWSIWWCLGLGRNADMIQQFDSIWFVQKFRNFSWWYLFHVSSCYSFYFFYSCGMLDTSFVQNVGQLIGKC